MQKMIPLSIPNFEGNEKKYVNEALDQGWVSTGGAYITRLEGQLAFLKYELEGEYLWVYETFLLPAADDEDGAQEAQYSFCELFEVPLDLDWEQVVRSKLVAYAYWPYVSEGKALDWDRTS